ncbi:MAG TPA: M20/M25/M40 family metallo-hydrolase [Vitreimonas sp.]|uniref:M20/M25/M40 family metallo-hydrolase n=1 Tax=Vitreimonas sp. TaxID=3069702 RepID=UPI002D32BE09|nr:M20/M25/M40 family metallo-hydrolase [Vitreimonas sp.]HYD87650.1 M20/M25/M40 family metallo-hydrolase [Vitreimonas sp.]
MLRDWCGRLIGAALLCFAAEAQAQAWVDVERPSARALYERIVSFDTSTGPQNVAMANFLAEHFRAGGFAADDVRIITANDTAGLLVRYRGDGSGGRPILLLAHMDVVPARREEWERDPFTMVEENGFFFGRGTLDNKAGIAHLASTFISMRDEGFTPTRDLIIWFSGDEETTGATTQALLGEHRGLIGDAEFALNSDAGGGQFDAQGRGFAYVVQTAEKTYASFTFTARNPGGHSSAPRADNAIYDLAAALARLRAFQFPVMWNDTTVQGFRNAANVFSGPEAAAMRRFAERPGDRVAARTLSQNPNISTLLRTTCVATMLTGGHAENALPQTASATVNCRIFPGVPVADVQNELRAIAGPNVEVAPLGPANFSDASPLRSDVMEATTRAVHASHPGVLITPFMSAGATDGLFFRAAGIPTYGVGAIFIGDEDDFAHGLNERVPVESFYQGLTHWRVLLTELAGRE